MAGLAPEHEQLLGLISRVERLGETVVDSFRQIEEAARLAGDVATASSTRRRRLEVQVHFHQVRELLVEEAQEAPRSRGAEGGS
jgi:hypothetical protein